MLWSICWIYVFRYAREIGISMNVKCWSLFGRLEQDLKSKALLSPHGRDLILMKSHVTRFYGLNFVLLTLKLSSWHAISHFSPSLAWFSVCCHAAAACLLSLGLGYWVLDLAILCTKQINHALSATTEYSAWFSSSSIIGRAGPSSAQ